MNSSSQHFFSASQIATARRCSKKTVQRRAKSERWPRRIQGNRFLYQPPKGLIGVCNLQTGRPSDLSAFRIGREVAAEALRASFRYAALRSIQDEITRGKSFEQAVNRVSRELSFQCSPTSLRRWAKRFLRLGFAGLLESKRGRVGRKPKGSQ